MTDPAPLALVTWFHADEAAAAGTYSQIRGSAASAAVHEVYLRCIDVCTASFRRWNPDGAGVVVLNPGGDRVVGEERRARWRRDRVAVEVVENTHRPDVELFREWQNQFFLFDVMRAALRVTDDPGAPFAVIDSDVLVRGPLDGLAAAIRADDRLRMRIPYEPDELANGSSRTDLAAYVEARTGAAPGFLPEYQGGEFVGATRAALADLVDACDDVYAWSLDRQRAGQRHPNEEAHMLSVADPVPAAGTLGNAWIERIWTKPWNYRAVPEDAASIPLWHLPTEKKSGIARLHAAVLERRSWFWHAPRDVWLERTSRIVGVPSYGPGKLLQDVVALRSDVLPAVTERLRRR